MADVHVLSLYGEFDRSRKDWFEDKLGEIEGFGPRATTIVDLTNVDDLDSMYLYALVRIGQRLHREQPGREIFVVVPGSDVVRNAGDTLMRDGFRLFGDLSSAREYVGA